MYKLIINSESIRILRYFDFQDLRILRSTESVPFVLRNGKNTERKNEGFVTGGLLSCFGIIREESEWCCYSCVC